MHVTTAAVSSVCESHAVSKGQPFHSLPPHPLPLNILQPVLGQSEPTRVLALTLAQQFGQSGVSVFITSHCNKVF